MSDFDQLDSLWGDDDEERGDFEPGYVPSRVPDFRDAKPARGFQWLAVIDEYGRDACPYADPRDEYIRNIHLVNILTLSYRWHGMGFEPMLLAMEHDTKLQQERLVVQALRRKEMELPDTNDPEYKEQMHRSNVLSMETQIKRVEYELETNIEFREQSDFVGGKIVRTYVTPVTMSEVARNRKLKLLIELQRHYRDMQGEDVKRVDVTVEHTDIRQRMKEIAKENNYRMQTGQTFDEFEAANVARREAELASKALPEPIIEEGEVLPE